MSGSELRAGFTAGLREFALELEVEVPPGRCLALVGRSGAGKSTALRVIAGLHRPDAGFVQLGAEVWFDSARGIDFAPERRACGYLFQDYALFPHLSAWQNVAFGLSREVERSRRRAVATELLEGFGVVALAEERPALLSGGERQRIALARALARAPGVLLLDEPLAALDATTASTASRQLSATLERIGVPAVLVTHDFGEAALLADEVAVIDRGRVVQRGSPSELSARPGSVFVADFTGASVLRGRAVAGPDGLTHVAIEGGGTLASIDRGAGAVAIAVYPWEVALEPLGEEHEGSALNRLVATITSVTEVGNRARVGLATPQPLAAEITSASASRLGLAPGVRVVASFKATATRLVSASTR